MLVRLLEPMMRKRTSRLSRRIASACERLLACYNRIDYAMETNGECALLERLAAFSPRCLFDVGANVGDYARLAAARWPLASVHSFEPVPATYAEFRERTKGEPRIHPHNLALLDRSGETRVKYYPSRSGSSGVYDYPHDAPSEWITIRAQTGDEFCDAAGIDRIDLLKIDVEGAEDSVIRGFERRLKEGRIDLVQFEYGYANIMSKCLLYDYVRWLGGLGYDLGKVMPGGVDFRPYKFQDEDFRGPNYVAVRRSSPELRAAVAGDWAG